MPLSILYGNVFVIEKVIHPEDEMECFLQQKSRIC